MSVVGQSHKPGQIPVSNEDIQQRFDQVRDLCKNLGIKCDMFKGFECLAYKYESATPPTCPASCVVCTEQFVPTGARNNSLSFEKIKLHDDQEATSIIENFIASIQSDYSFIRSKIQTHGNTIAKRWQKKSSTKREQLLRSAVPDISPKRNIDIEYVFQGINYFVDSMHNRVSDKTFETQQTKPEEPYLATFLNIESLSEEPMRLLALMHHRAHAHPSEWISFDREMIQTYFDGGNLRCAYNPRCVMIHGSTFGNLVQWSRDAAHRWQMIGYPLARHLFRVQAKISNFLRRVVTSLLQFAEEEASKGREVWDRLVATSFRHEDCFVAPSAYYSQVFAPPPNFDSDHILKAFEIRAYAAIDEAQLVQADPPYLRRLLHQMEKGPTYELMDEAARLQALYTLTVRSMLKRHHWGYLAAAAMWLRQYSLRQHQGMLYLPSQYEEDLRAVEVASRVQFETLVSELSQFVCESHAFRHHFRNGQQITDPEMAYRIDPLFWALIELVVQTINVNRPAAWCLSFIEEHLAKASPKERARIDQQLYDQISDIALVDETLTAIKAHQSYTPLSRNAEEATPLHQKLYNGTI